MKLLSFLMDFAPEDGVVIVVPYFEESDRLNDEGVYKYLEMGKYAKYPNLKQYKSSEGIGNYLASFSYYKETAEQSWLLRDIIKVEPIVDYTEVEKYGNDENVVISYYLLVLVDIYDTKSDIDCLVRLNNAPIKVRRCN